MNGIIEDAEENNVTNQNSMKDYSYQNDFAPATLEQKMPKQPKKKAKAKAVSRDKTEMLRSDTTLKMASINLAEELKQIRPFKMGSEFEPPADSSRGPTSIADEPLTAMIDPTDFGNLSFQVNNNGNVKK